MSLSYDMEMAPPDEDYVQSQRRVIAPASLSFHHHTFRQAAIDPALLALHSQQDAFTNSTVPTLHSHSLAASHDEFELACLDIGDALAGGENNDDGEYLRCTKTNVHRDYFQPTPFSQYFQTLDQIMDVYYLLDIYLQQGLSGEEVISRVSQQLIPNDCDFLRLQTQQFAQNKNKDCCVIFGTCRKFAGVPSLQYPSCNTERLAAAVGLPFQLAGMGLLFIDLRKECRRRGDFCYGFKESELKNCALGTAIEVFAAARAFNIRIKCAVTFAEPWFLAWPFLQSTPPGQFLQRVPRLHIGPHLGHITNHRSSKRQILNTRSQFMQTLSARMAQDFSFVGDAAYIYRTFYTYLENTSLPILAPGARFRMEPTASELLLPYEPDKASERRRRKELLAFTRQQVVLKQEEVSSEKATTLPINSAMSSAPGAPSRSVSALRSAAPSRSGAELLFITASPSSMATPSSTASPSNKHQMAAGARGSVKRPWTKAEKALLLEHLQKKTDIGEIHDLDMFAGRTRVALENQMWKLRRKGPMTKRGPNTKRSSSQATSQAKGLIWAETFVADSSGDMQKLHTFLEMQESHTSDRPSRVTRSSTRLPTSE